MINFNIEDNEENVNEFYVKHLMRESDHLLAPRQHTQYYSLNPLMIVGGTEGIETYHHFLCILNCLEKCFLVGHMSEVREES